MTPNQVVDSATFNTLSLRKFDSMKVCIYIAFDSSLKSSVFDSAGCVTLSLTKHRYIMENYNLLFICARHSQQFQRC